MCSNNCSVLVALLRMIHSLLVPPITTVALVRHMLEHLDRSCMIDRCHHGLLRANAVQAQYAQRDLAGNKARKFFKSFHLPSVLASETIKVEATFPCELQNVLLHSISPSGMPPRASIENSSDASVLAASQTSIGQPDETFATP